MEGPRRLPNSVLLDCRFYTKINCKRQASAKWYENRKQGSINVKPNQLYKLELFSFWNTLLEKIRKQDSTKIASKDYTFTEL